MVTTHWATHVCTFDAATGGRVAQRTFVCGSDNPRQQWPWFDFRAMCPYLGKQRLEGPRGLAAVAVEDGCDVYTASLGSLQRLHARVKNGLDK
jgi:hypothetical protein